MYISPPIGVLAILAVGLASTAWIPPQPREIAQATVVLPAATYEKFALWGNEHIGADGQPLTVVQVIKEFVKRWDKDNESSTN